MRFDIEKIISYMKILLCISIIGLWIFWLSKNSTTENQRAEEHVEPTNQQAIELTKDQKVEITNETSKQKQEAKKKVDKVKPQQDEFPQLATLTPLKETEEKKIKETPRKIENKPVALLPPSKVAPKLREKVQVEKSQYKQASKIIEETDLQESWLPKYIQETNNLNSKIKNITSNLDQIANQLELAGIINNPNGEGAAIIRNKSNNKIEVLKKGEEYQGLKLLEIKNNEVVLGNQNLNKSYIKKIININR